MLRRKTPEQIIEEHELKNAGILSPGEKVGEAAGKGILVLLGTFLISALTILIVILGVGSLIGVVFGLVGIVLKLFGVAVMASWSYLTLIIILVVSMLVRSIFS